ncbi:MAG: 2-C-methyl-D-erythritol 2,4-cyclodiphosphate synthase [Synechococcales cyanobacterium]
MRIGNGYDIHQLVPDRPLILGGIPLPYEKGLLGHSDADVLTHAIMDALLGACALGDIGHYFPPGDPEWAGADSQKLLGRVIGLIQERGWQVGNVDAVVIAEAPKLKPHIPAMRAQLATTMGIPVDAVSVKATTNEKLDAVGAGAGIAAYAVALLLPGYNTIKEY